MVRWFCLMIALLGLAAGCEDRVDTPAAALQGSAEPGSVLRPSPSPNPDPSIPEAIGRLDFETSPPTAPDMKWSELTPMIEAARAQLSSDPIVEAPAAAADPLAERTTAAQLRAIAAAGGQAMVYRAEAARLVARGDPDAAAIELARVLDLARSLATWGVPSAAEASARMIAIVLDAVEQPRAAPAPGAMSPAARSVLRDALAGLDSTDPAGRMRAMVETHADRSRALAEHAAGADGPTVVRSIASRYRRGVVRGSPADIQRSIEEASAFAMALADTWDKPARSAVTQRLRERTQANGSGVLTILLGEAPDACDADAQLRARIATAIEGLR